MNLFELKAALDAVATTGVKKEKEELLRQHSKNPTFLKIVEFLLNEKKISGLSSKKLNMRKDFLVWENHENETIESLIDYLVSNNTGRTEDIRRVHAFIEEQDEELTEFLEAVVTKSLRLGLTAKTVNKALGYDVIPIFEVQLAKPMGDPEKLAKEKNMTETIKLDGHRILCEISWEQSVSFFTRKGNPVLGLTEIEDKLKEIIFGDRDKEKELSTLYPSGIVLDGEILVQKTDKPLKAWFNETSKLVRKDGEKTNLRYVVFEGLPLDEFRAGQSKKVYLDRRKDLEVFDFAPYAYFGQESTSVVELLPILHTGDGNDMTVFYELYEQAIARGEEGTMINLNVPYKCKRHDGILKMKPSFSADLEIVGFEQGAAYTKYADTLGAILVDFNGTVVSVGSGLSDDLREKFWSNQEKYIGMIAAIDYTDTSVNQNDNSISLRFPRFKCIREDKTVDDVNVEGV